MARVKFFVTTDMSNIPPLFGDLVLATSTRIVIEGGDLRATFVGKGFQYSGFEVVGGTLTGYEVEVAGKTLATVSGGAVSAPLAADLILDGNITELVRIALRNDDEIIGSRGSDLLLGFAGKDEIDGGAGNDSIAGQSGNDLLVGGTGRDLILGGAGRDTLEGGRSADRFAFIAASESKASAPDVISDFSRAEDDLIDLSFIDARRDLAGNQKFSFIGDASFSGRGQVRYDDGVLAGDIDGDRRADFAIVVDIANLSKADLVL